MERLMYTTIGVLLGLMVGACLVLVTDPRGAELEAAREAIARLEQSAVAGPPPAVAATATALAAEIPPPPTAATLPRGTPPPSITAKELYTAFQDNEIAADQKFVDKLYAIKGTVRDVGKDVVGTPYVALLAEDDAFGCVQCMFDSTGGLAVLSEGDSVVIIGRVSGLMMNVIVRECEIADSRFW